MILLFFSVLVILFLLLNYYISLLGIFHFKKTFIQCDFFQSILKPLEKNCLFCINLPDDER